MFLFLSHTLIHVHIYVAEQNWCISKERSQLLIKMGVYGGEALVKLSRQFYAVFCLGVVLISLVVANQYYRSQSDDDEVSAPRRRQPPNRRLAASN